MNSDVLTQELTCPITRELLVDPITLPCCGKSVSRFALRSALNVSTSCPLCRALLGPSDTADRAPRNLVAQALLDSLVASGHVTENGGAEAATAVVDTIPEEIQHVEEDAPRATYCLLPAVTGAGGGKNGGSRSLGRIARLQMRIANASRVGLRRVLCILVVDQSGSMAGAPWRQASLAMKHVVAMSQQPHVASHVTLKLVTYNSSARILDSSGSVDDVHRRIDTVRPGYGTSFRAAFAKAEEVMKSAAIASLVGREVVLRGLASREDLNGSVGRVISCDGITGRFTISVSGVGAPVSVRPSNIEWQEPNSAKADGEAPQQVSVVFMTDGQASEPRGGLADEFRAGIAAFRRFCAEEIPLASPSSAAEVTVHAVGFSSGCDRSLLNQMRESGTSPGQFRYCEPGDSEDALCGRITSMFESVAAHGGCDVTMQRLKSPVISTDRGNENAGEDGEGFLPPSWEFLDQDGRSLPSCEAGKVRVQLRIKPDGVGTAVAWLSIKSSPPEGDGTPLILPVAVTCNAESEPEEEERCPAATEGVKAEEGSGGPAVRPDWMVDAVEDASFASVDAVKRAWIGVRIHAIAEDAIELVETATKPSNSAVPLPPEAVRLWGAFLENRLRAVSTIGSDAHGRVPSLLEQLQGLARWGHDRAPAVSIGRLRDISSASAFSSSRAPVASSPNTARQQSFPQKSRAQTLTPVPLPRQAVVGQGARRREAIVFYTGNHGAAGRNKIQSAVMGWGQRSGADELVTGLLCGMEPEDRKAAVSAMDSDGNTAIHLAAYHGQYDAIPALLEAAGPVFDVDMPNHHNESPVTIAVKRRGYHKTVEILQSFGGSIPGDRVEDLVAFSLTRDFPRTAAFLQQRVIDGALGPAEGQRNVSSAGLQSGADLPTLVFDDGMPHTVVKMRLKAATKQGRPINGVSLVRVALRLTDKELLESGLDLVAASDIDPAWIFAYCFPKRADAPDTPLFLVLLEQVLDFAPDLLSETQPESGDTLLHRAVTSGSLPHVQCLVDKGLSPDVRNSLGNSPLHAACDRRYPCIVDFLVAAGADTNATNRNGISPTAVAVQMGSARIVETLVAAGAVLDGLEAVDISGNNLLHVAVRNNQANILAMLLDQVDPEIMLNVDSKGFTPVLAAVEENRKECLTVLLDAAADYARMNVHGFVTVATVDAGEHEHSSASPNGNPVLEWKTPSESPILPGATALHVAAFFGRSLALSMLLDRGADPNVRDGHGLSPLHLAAQRGDAAAVFALIARGASPSDTDRDGRTPASLAEGHPEVMAALLGPVPGPLREFALGNMLESAVSACAGVVRRASCIAAEPGLLDSAKVLDAPLEEFTKQSALAAAASHGNYVAADALVAAGASAELEDARGISAAAWAQMSKNRRLLAALDVPLRPLLPAAQLHAEAVRRFGGGDAMAVFLGGKRDPSWPAPSRGTSLHRRLGLLAAAFDGRASVMCPPQSVALLRTAPRTGSVDRVSMGPLGSEEQLSLDADRWVCRIDAAAAVARGTSLRPSHAFAVLLATRHGPLVPFLNAFLSHSPDNHRSLPATNRPILDFGVALWDTVEGLPLVTQAESPTSTVELYAISPPELHRSSLRVGSEVTLDGFASATMDWSVALSALDTHQAKRSSATSFASSQSVMIVISKSRSGRALGKDSAFPEEKEIMFPPGTRFRVTRWCRGDIQAFRRCAGREKAFCLSPEEITAATEGRGALVAILEEI